MSRLAEAEACLVSLLGSEPLELFRAQMEDLKCYSKALSLTDLNSDLDEVKEKLEVICQGILAEAVNVFLRRDYSDDGGSVEINVAKRTVYDKDMNPILPLKGFQENQRKIVLAMMAEVLPIFENGRELAIRIIERRRKYLHSGPKKVRTGLQTTTRRDYEKFPPKELLSIELMRLERKLPNLSPEEGLRLSELYQQVQAKVIA
jgi:hypothetical protein